MQEHRHGWSFADDSYIVKRQAFVCCETENNVDLAGKLKYTL